MLVIDGLSKIYGTNPAVDSVSLSIKPGSFVGVIGRSGAGKSTLLRMINRLNDPTHGRIMFDGVDVTALKGAELREWRRRWARRAVRWPVRSLSGRGNGGGGRNSGTSPPR